VAGGIGRIIPSIRVAPVTRMPPQCNGTRGAEVAQSYIALMDPNREIAPSTPSGPRRRAEGGSLRERFRDSIRDALSGVDVDELQGQTRTSPPTGEDVPPVMRPTITGLEAELRALRAERAELERRAARGNRAAAAVREVVAPPALPAAPPPPVGDISAVPWSPDRARVPVPPPIGPGLPPASVPAVRQPIPPDAVARVPRPPGAVARMSRPPDAVSGVPRPPGAVAPMSRPPDAVSGVPRLPAAVSRPRRGRAVARDVELESVVAPLLAEVASLRAEVEQLRGPSRPGPSGPADTARGRQLLKLVIGVLVGFALIVIALAVVLKA
jgi:hypothetical protein